MITNSKYSEELRAISKKLLLSSTNLGLADYKFKLSTTLFCNSLTPNQLIQFQLEIDPSEMSKVSKALLKTAEKNYEKLKKINSKHQKLYREFEECALEV